MHTFLLILDMLCYQKWKDFFLFNVNISWINYFLFIKLLFSNFIKKKILNPFVYLKDIKKMKWMDPNCPSNDLLVNLKC